jgi:hypothetical protein
MPCIRLNRLEGHQGMRRICGNLRKKLAVEKMCNMANVCRRKTWWNGPITRIWQNCPPDAIAMEALAAQ